MTLYERAQTAISQESKTVVKPDSLQMLRQQMEKLVSVDELAILAASNPNRAKNEVVSACRRAFEDTSWIYTGIAERNALVDQLMDQLFGYGVIHALLEDDSITEVMVNGPGSVFFERSGTLHRAECKFADEQELRALIDRILGPLGRRIDEASPMVNARLPQGHRVNVVVPPIAPDGPLVTIRKFSRHVITLDEMTAAGSIEPSVKTALEWAVKARKSIAVTGGTGSGKTTMLNALSCAIPHEERIITIEDSAELRFHEHPHVVRLEARPRNAEGMGEVTIRDLVTNALRMRPDRIVVGECRGAEALDMLQAMNTGHAGSLTTLHSNSPAESISRLETMVRYDGDLPVDVIEANIASAISLVVQTIRLPDGKRIVCEIAELAFLPDGRRCVAQPLYERGLTDECGFWRKAPRWFDELPALGVADDAEVEKWVSEYL